MSATSNAAQPEGWVTMADAVHAWNELNVLRAELSTLKARRCDGCVHATPIPMQYRTPGPERWYWCGNAAKNGDDWGTFTTDGPFVVAASHSCAAWTEKP